MDDELVAVSMIHHFRSVLPELRVQPTMKRVRVVLAGEPVADTTAARLVWEPKRIVPSYAVPERDLTAELVAATEESSSVEHPVALGEGPPVLDPSSPFGVHTTPGQPLTVVAGSARAEGAAFRVDDPDLAGYVILDFAAFDWFEEDEPIVGHPRDPFSRIDIRRASRHVRFEIDGAALAESTRPQMLFESAFPMARYYLPREDVLVALAPGTSNTTCAYKGHATHYSAIVGGRQLANIAWSYENPLPDVIAITGLVCFYQEQLDLVVDGERVPRPRTPWS
jgi:uncharacterized protein (DUF427 family)